MKIFSAINVQFKAFIGKIYAFINRIFSICTSFLRRLKLYAKIAIGLILIIFVFILFFSTTLHKKIDEYFVDHDFIISNVVLRGNKYLRNDVFAEILMSDIPSFKYSNGAGDDIFLTYKSILIPEDITWVMKNGKWLFKSVDKSYVKSACGRARSSSVMINFDSIIQKITSIGLVKHIVIKRFLPHLVLVDISEYTPIACIKIMQDCDRKVAYFLTDYKSIINVNADQIRDNIFENLPVIFIQNIDDMEYVKQNIRDVLVLVHAAQEFLVKYDIFFELTASYRFNMVLVDKKHMSIFSENVIKILHLFNGSNVKNLGAIFVKLNRNYPINSVFVLKKFMNSSNFDNQYASPSVSIIIDLRFKDKILVKKSQ